jgi:hypothetical protein
MIDKKRESFILGKLDKKTILVATPHAFVIKERIKSADGEVGWASKYYYSEIGDAIRGYARHLLRRPSTAKHLDGNLKTLIDLIVKLESTIKKVGDKLNLEFAERLEDPIESHLFNSGDNQ